MTQEDDGGPFTALIGVDRIRNSFTRQSGGRDPCQDFMQQLSFERKRLSIAMLYLLTDFEKEKMRN